MKATKANAGNSGVSSLWWWLLLLSLLNVQATAIAQERPHKPPLLVAGLGGLHYPVSTADPEAQHFFDQGLAFVYAFNHDEAVRSFKRAAELDPGLAMAYWGIALALGPNINMDVDPDRERAAYEAIQKALRLAAKASAQERAYIEALAKRYAIDFPVDLKKLAVDYKEAMGELIKRYPDDLDAAVLYAESAMDLRPWRLWNADGGPAAGTEEIVAVLESVLKRDPKHLGANHYYIHAVEASPHPERALASAKRLETLAPRAGHLLHMPAHIYLRTGDYIGAARSNAAAADVDRAYIKNHGEGMYSDLYYHHNLHFLAIAYSMAGRFQDAKHAADQLLTAIAPHHEDPAGFPAWQAALDAYMPTSTLILVRFRKWQELLEVPEPDSRLPVTTALWHFARGLAYAATSRLADGEAELRQLTAAHQAISPEAMYGFNKAATVVAIAASVLRAKISSAKGNQRDAIELYRKAIQMEDALAYNEPPDWYLPVRESLGAALLQNGEYAEAERVFREDLTRRPRNGRSLFGLLKCLEAQGKQTAAAVRPEYENAWKEADTQLHLEDL